ncbi:hypothetical protein ACFL59_07500 [Planctomycetota bacterium]
MERGRDYVLDARNVHALASTLESYARDKHYAVLLDASVWAPFDRLLAAERLGKLAPKRMLSLQVFYSELLRIIESYDNIVVVPEIKIELANLIAASNAQIDRQKLQYQQLSPAKKDRVSRVFSTLLRLEETLRKLRTRLEDRVRAGPRVEATVLGLLTETIVAIAETLRLKKPDTVTSSDVDERLVAHAFYDLLWNHRLVAVYTRDEDVRRVVSAAYKLMVSQTIRDDSVNLVVKALKLGNLVVLKYNAEREQYSRFFESQTQKEIGEYIFSKFLSERAKVKLVTLVRGNMARLGKMLLERGDDPGEVERPALEAPERLLEALGMIHDRMVWYQEVARAVGVTDVHEDIRITGALKEIAEGLRHSDLARSVARTLEGLMRKRITLYLRDLEAKDEALRCELAEVTEGSRYQRDLRSAERLGEIAHEIASNAREKHFFARALGMGDFYLTQEHFRRTEDILERLSANGYDVREKECLVPVSDLADLTGRDYQSLLRLASEHRLGTDGGLVRIDLSTVIRHLI